MSSFFLLISFDLIFNLIYFWYLFSEKACAEVNFFLISKRQWLILGIKIIMLMHWCSRERKINSNIYFARKTGCCKVCFLSKSWCWLCCYQNLRGALVSQICREILQFAARLWGISPQWSYKETMGAMSGWVWFYDTNNLRHTYLLNICHWLVLVYSDVTLWWRDSEVERR